MTKLTLSVDEEIVEQAKTIARTRGTSVSAMFSEFVRAASAPRRRPRTMGPLTRKVSGLVKLPPGGDYKELLTEALMEKYGIEE